MNSSELGRLELSEGNYKEAAFRRDANTLYLLASAYSKLNRLPEARDTIHEILRSGHRSTRVYELAAAVDPERSRLYHKEKESIERKPLPWSMILGVGLVMAAIVGRIYRKQ